MARQRCEKEEKKETMLKKIEMGLDGREMSVEEETKILKW